MKHLLTWLQINDYTLRNKERWLWVLKIVITAFCLWFLITKLQSTQYPPGSLLISSKVLPWILLVLALVPLNWFLEIQKWRASIPEEQLSFQEGLQAVLCGLALNWLMPFTLGDVSGRLSNVKNIRRTGVALVANRALSMGITLSYGGYAFLYFKEYPMSLYGWVVAVILLAFVMVAVMYGVRELVTFRQMLWYTLLRYLVFTFQFVVLIWAFVPQLSLEIIFIGVGWIFLFRTIVPALFGNIGVREASAVVFFESYLESAAIILIPCVLIWIINNVLPSLVGLGLMFKLRVNIAR
ncbi:hypothetical protein [Marinoscillum sp.]|uniref:hypothetical protein n=1 Tax=Marinoscillum sp. TaxID=2024838 RepID=UPI003BAB46A6